MPTPFSQTTEISYQVPVKTQVNLKIYDPSGRLVRTLVNEEKQVGEYKIRCDGKDDRNSRLASGIYFYRLETKAYKKTKKLLILR